MAMRRVWLLGVGMAAVGAATVQAAPRQIGRYNDWVALRDESGPAPQCFLVERPGASEPVRSGTEKAMLAVRRMAGSQDLVAVMTGMKVDSLAAEVRINGQEFPFAKTTNGLEAKEVDRTLAALAAGGELVVRLGAAGQTLVEDRYPLVGFGQGYQALAAGCALTTTPQAQNALPTLPAVVSPAGHHEVPLHHMSGVATLPVLVNGVAVLEFVVDSGAAEIGIPEDVFERLQRDGVVSERDFTGEGRFRTADGRTYTSRVFRLRMVQLGNQRFTDISAHVSPKGSPMLLGQSLLGKLHSWSVDNQRGVFLWD